MHLEPTRPEPGSVTLSAETVDALGQLLAHASTVVLDDDASDMVWQARGWLLDCQDAEASS